MNDSLQNDARNISATQHLSPTQWHAQRRELFETTGIDAVDHEGCFSWSTLEDYNQLIQRVGSEVDPQRAQQLDLRLLSPDQLISVVVPVFNEHTTIERVLRMLASCPIVGQIIVVNDASSDGTDSVLERIAEEREQPFWTSRLPAGLTTISHPTNRGKGAALKSGFPEARLRWVAIQDADTEYEPMDMIRLMNATIVDRATVVYGSRYLSATNHSSPLWHRLGNGAITQAANWFNGLRLTDVETCYKLVRQDILNSVCAGLKEDRFGIEIELTAKLARHPESRIVERPILYRKRSYAEGKKIGVKDGVRALWCMVRYRWRD